MEPAHPQRTEFHNWERFGKVAAFSFSRAHERARKQGMGSDEALGYALAADYSSREPVVDHDNIIIGMPRSSSLVQLGRDGLCCVSEVPQTLVGTEHEEEARAVIAYWRPRTTQAQFAAVQELEFTSEELIAHQEPFIGWAGNHGGHTILGYDYVLSEGIDGLERHVRRHMERVEKAGTEPETLDWYRALLHVCGGISVFMDNHARRARELGEVASDPNEKQRLEQIATVCGWVAHKGARNLREAVQLFWFLHLLDGTDSPGRIDQFLWPYFERLPGDADARREAAVPVLDALWRKFIACRSWNVCLAGQSPDGRDATNELTFLFLDLQEQHGGEAPNLSVRFFRGSPRRLMKRCVVVLSKGSGMPALYNDEVLVPALCDLGIPIEHARDYAMNGCAQVDIQGRSHMGLEDGEISLAKCLELALHGGMSTLTGNQAGCRTPNVDDIRTFEELRKAFVRQIKHCTRIYTHRANVTQRVYAETGPHLFRSLFVEGCVARGVDFKRGGALYNHGQFLTQGIANTGNALYTIKRLVFDQKRFTLPELVRILDSDWEEHEKLRQEIHQRFPKYGNDIDEVDQQVAWTVTQYYRILNTIRTWRGLRFGEGRYSGGTAAFIKFVRYGAALSASADGRSKGEPLADSIGPVQGDDRHGPSAMLKSAAKLPQGLATSGMLLNLKLSPAVLHSGDGGVDKVVDLFLTYFRLDGQQLQVNVVERETLITAQQEPDKHADLVVRVAGFCAKFVTLDRAVQDDIIARVSHEI